MVVGCRIKQHGQQVAHPTVYFFVVKLKHPQTSLGVAPVWMLVGLGIVKGSEYESV